MTKPTLLFVDDEKNILKSLRRLFIKEGYEILTADCGAKALKLIQEGAKPQVIISDQRMPEMNGTDFLSKAKNLLPNSIRIMLTGYSDINAAVDAINLGGIYQCILKPWDDDKLKSIVQGAVERFNRLQKERLAVDKLLEKKLLLDERNGKLEKKIKQIKKELRKEQKKTLELTRLLKKKG